MISLFTSRVSVSSSTLEHPTPGSPPLSVLQKLKGPKLKLRHLILYCRNGSSHSSSLLHNLELQRPSARYSGVLVFQRAFDGNNDFWKSE